MLTANNKSGFYNIVAYIYLASFVMVAIFFGLSPMTFILFSIMAAVFIIPSAKLGLGVIITLTMIFERFFTLQPLIIDQQIYKIYPLDIIIGLIIISLLLGWRFKKEKIKFFFGKPEILLTGFIILNVIYLTVANFNANADFSVAFSTFKNYAFYPLLYFITIYSVQNSRKLKNMINFILFTGLILIAFMAIGFIRGEGLWTEFTPLSTGGVRFLAGTHAFYLVLAIIIALSLLVKDRFYNKGLANLVLWIWLVGILASLMRHLWLALAFGAFVLFLLINKKDKIKFISYGAKNLIVAISIIAIILLTTSLSPNINSLDNFTKPIENFTNRIVSVSDISQDSSAAWRVNLWQSANKAWMSNPILGIGFGKKIPLEVDKWKTFEEVRNLHNSLIAITVQMGIVGIVVFLAFIFMVIKKSWKNIFTNYDLSPYYIGITACILVILFCSLFQPYLETNLTGIFLWIMLGLLRTSKLTTENHV